LGGTPLKSGTREYHRRKWREYYARNRTRLLAARAARRPTHAEQEEAYRRKAYVAHRAKLLYRGARNRAKERGIEFTISYGDVVIPPVCPVFGEPFYLEGRRCAQSRFAPSIDRIDRSRGYVPGNILVVSIRANQIKSDATSAEIQRVADFYSRLESGGTSVP
jgi:hypothetical protein